MGEVKIFWKKTVHAKVLCKEAEETEDPPVFGASGSNSLPALSAMPDESRSMWKRTAVYFVSFTVGHKTKDFFVDQKTYEELEPNEEGTLNYKGSTFLSFDPSGTGIFLTENHV